MKKLFLTLTLLVGFATVSFCDDPPPFNPGGPASIPVDGGAIFLLAAATGYGVNRLNPKKQIDKKS